MTKSSAKRRDSIRPLKPKHSTPTRGKSLQGELQAAKGGPAGANQGGASRGGSRVEPSHQKQAAKERQPKQKR